MNNILKNKSVEIYKLDNNIYHIKVIKSSPKKNDIKEYHAKLLQIYSQNEDENKKFSLIFDLKLCGIWSVGFASSEFKFLDKLGEKSIKYVTSWYIVSSSYIWKIINYFISESKKKVPFKLCNTFQKQLNILINKIRFSCKIKKSYKFWSTCQPVWYSDDKKL